MRVLLVSHGYPPRDAGGVELHTQAVARGLASAGDSVRVFTAAAERDGMRMVANEQDGAVRVRRLHVPIGEDFARLVLRPWVRTQFEQLLDDQPVLAEQPNPGAVGKLEGGWFPRQLEGVHVPVVE